MNPINFKERANFIRIKKSMYRGSGVYCISLKEEEL